MLLADFNSVFQISVGLHLAYTFLPDLHEYYLRRLEDYASSTAKVADSPPEDADGSILKDRLRYFRYLITDRKRVVDSRIFWMQVLATFIASLSVVLLVIAAVWPKLDVRGFLIGCLLAITLLPMPTFCLYSYVSHRAWLRRIAVYRKKVQEEWMRLMLPVIDKIKRLSEKHGERKA